MKKKLTAKEQTFVHEYLVDKNATQAAIRSGYSERSARQLANRLLSKDYIVEELDKLNKKILEKVDVTVESVLRNIEETRKLALADCKYQSVLKALEMQGKHLAMFTDKLEVTDKTPPEEWSTAEIQQRLNEIRKAH